jgi:Flp pilus assembly pilin Flp
VKTTIEKIEMKKSILLLFVLTFLNNLGFGQVQIGNDINGEAAGDNSGSVTALSSDGSVLAVGAHFNQGNGSSAGHVRVFGDLNGTWTQIGDDIDGESFGNQSGRSVSLSSDGSIVAIGEPIDSENGSVSGQVRVFENVGGVWMQIGSDINGDVFDFQTGISVDLSSDGSILSVGSYGAPVSGIGFYVGKVRVYENQGGFWVQIGSDIDGQAEQDFFGASMSLSSDGTTIAIGALGDFVNLNGAGYVKIYENQGGSWTQVGGSIDGTITGSDFGNTVSISSDGSIVAVGGPFESPEGKVQIFENVAGMWTQIGSDIEGEATNDRFGNSVSLSGDGTLIAVGARTNSSSSVNSGRSYIYENQGGIWVNVLNTIDGEAAGDGAGYSVSLSTDGNTVAIGAPGNDDNGDGSGHVRVYDLSGTNSMDAINQDLASLSLSPNPASDFLSIGLNENIHLESVRVFDNSGQLLMTTKEAQLDVSQLASGLYTVVIDSDKGNKSAKFVKF